MASSAAKKKKKRKKGETETEKRKNIKYSMNSLLKYSETIIQLTLKVVCVVFHVACMSQ